MLCGFLLLGLRYPPMPRDVVSALIIGAGFLLSVATLLLVASHPGWARALAVPLALYGLLMLINGVRTAMEYSSATESPATTISRGLALMLAGAWIAGLWHLRIVGRSRPAASSAPQPDEVKSGPTSVQVPAGQASPS